MDFNTKLFRPVLTPDSIAGFDIAKGPLAAMRFVLDSTLHLDGSGQPGNLEGGPLRPAADVRNMSGILDESLAEAMVTDKDFGMLHIGPARDITSYIRFLASWPHEGLLQEAQRRATTARHMADYGPVQPVPHQMPYPIRRLGSLLCPRVVVASNNRHALLLRLHKSETEQQALVEQLDETMTALGITAACGLSGILDIIDAGSFEANLARDNLIFPDEQ